MNCITAILFLTAAPLWAQTSFALKSAPPDLQVFLDGQLIEPVSTTGTLRNFLLSGAGVVRFSADGYRSVEFSSAALPIRNNILGIKLENYPGILQRINEYSTGSQPKSAYFSPCGQRVFVPLLNQHGIDVFRMRGEALEFERRLTVPGSTAVGFVEAMFDTRRRELWVSNMVENRVHIFDLDTLAHKTSMPTGGRFPKVIAQSPNGSLTVVSNWITHDLSVFDSDTKKLLRRIPVGGIPRGMAFSADGSLLYTAIFCEPLIAVINMAQNRVVSSFRLYEGRGAARHVVYRSGRLYVSDMYRGTVNILNASTGALLRSRRIGPNINTIVLSPDGRHVFASSRGRNNPKTYLLPGPDFGAIFKLNAGDLSLVERVWGRNQPTGLDVSPDGRFLVFTNFLDASLELYRLP
ncbi:MAG: YncE family protein [Spirochaetes bacterium]|nr:YncE family protein [Spirochaetota bacterium]